jgi:hypothetical protein
VGYRQRAPSLGQGADRQWASTEGLFFFWVLMVCLFGIQESGDFVHSFSSQHLRPDDGHVVDSEEEDIIKWAGGALYFGGADTVRTLRWIFRRLTDDNSDRSIGPIVHSSHDAVP